MTSGFCFGGLFLSGFIVLLGQLACMLNSRNMKVIALLVFCGLFGMTMGVFLPVGVGLGKLQAKLMTRLARRKILSNTTVKAQYEAPHHLTAVELGYLFDNNFGDSEYFAAILELGDSGHLELVYDGKTLRYKKIATNTKGLLGYQKLLFDQVKDTGIARPNEVIYFQNTALSREVKAGLVRKGYYDKKPFWQKRLKAAALISALLGAVYAGLLAALTMRPTSETGINYSYNGQVVDRYPFGVALMFGIIFGFTVALFTFIQMLYVVYRYNKALGFGPDATDKLRDEWVDILGYRHYLQTVEQDNLTYELETEQSISGRHLAAALALRAVSHEALYKPETA